MVRKRNKQKYSVVSVLFVLVIPMLLVFTLFTETAAGDENWWDEDWDYRKLVTWSATDITDSTITNFPCLLNISSDADLASNALSTGNDICFIAYEDNSTQFSHEIELWDSGTGQLIAWINDTSLDTRRVWMYYGNAGASKQEDPDNVWDSNYVIVLHMDGMLDSTSLSNDMTDDGTDNSTGMFGYARGFVRANTDQMTRADDSDLDFAGDFTIEVLANSDLSDDKGVIANKYDGTDGYRFGVWDDDDMWLGIKDNGGSLFGDGPDENVNQGWYYLVGARTGSDIWAWVDMDLALETSATSGDLSNADAFYMGQRNDNSFWYTGVIDEFRMSKIYRTDNWLKTCKNMYFNATATNWFTLGVEDERGVQNLELTNEFPSNDSNIISVQPTIYFTLANALGGMSYSLYVGETITTVNYLLDSATSLDNGTFHYVNYYNATEYNTWYYYRVHYNDSEAHVNETFRFRPVRSGGGMAGSNGVAVVLGMGSGVLGGLVVAMVVVRRKRKDKAE